MPDVRRVDLPSYPDGFRSPGKRRQCCAPERLPSLIGFRRTAPSGEAREYIVALQHAKPGEIVDLRPLGGKLKDAKTAAIIKSEHFEAVRLIVLAGSEIPPHKVPGNIMLIAWKGAYRLAWRTLRLH